MSKTDFEYSVEYVNNRVKEMHTRPEFNKTQIAVYEEYLAAAQGGPDAYLKKAGDFFAVRRAEEVDRVDNLARLYQSLHFPEAVDAAEKLKSAVSRSTGYADIMDAGNPERKEMEKRVSLENQKRHALMELCGVIIAYAAARPADKTGKKSLIMEAAEKMFSVDPGFTWEKLATHPPYTKLLYYTSAQLKNLESWYREAVDN